MGNISKSKRQAMQSRIDNAPPPAPEKGTKEWKKARNARRNARVKAVERLRALNTR